MIGWIRALWPGPSLRVNLRDELAKLGNEYQAERRRNEEMAVELRREKGRRFDAQAKQAAAEKAAADLGDRIERAVQILADPERPSAQGNVQARLILAGNGAPRLLPEGEGSGDG